MKANKIAQTATKLVSGSRARTHGDKHETFATIARLWSAYVGVSISAEDVAHMMVLLKIARTQGGQHNLDDYVDMCGYAACAGEIAAKVRNRA